MGTGEEQETIDEVKAEIIYRALIPSILEKGGMPGIKQEWAIGLTATSLQELATESEDSDYSINQCYALNDLFEKGTITEKNGSFTIHDYDAYFETVKKAALEIISVYQDKTMTPKKAAAWIEKRCKPNKKLREAIKALKQGNKK